MYVFSLVHYDRGPSRPLEPADPLEPARKDKQLRYEFYDVLCAESSRAATAMQRRGERGRPE